MSATSISKLEPQSLWASFEQLNAVPRPSKKEERVSKFMADFGKSLGLETQVDSTGNVLIRKAGSRGRENAPIVVLQSHLDMVHQKNAGTNFDFDREGIKMRIEGDWIRAEGTTLGADNGIGVAAIMAILSSPDIEHPPLEALFTIDEETGMTGAKELKPGWINGKILLNLDTEDDRELTIGCAGGVDVTGKARYQLEPTPARHSGHKLAVRGLTGGHSGMEIHLGRGNSNKLMNRLLWQLAEQFSIRLASFEGGSLRNAIPREAFAVLAIEENKAAAAKAFVEQEASVLKNEYSITDPGLVITWEDCEAPSKVLATSDQSAALHATYAVPNGIFRMSPSVAGLVQTSNNLAKITLKDGQMEWACLTRSSVDSERHDLARMIKAALLSAKADVTFAGDYPGWQPEPTSKIVSLMKRVYQDQFQSDPNVAACHAGLECGIIGAHYPGMEMISFGPNILGAHSPDEKVQISSVQKFWKYLLKTLSEIK